MNGFSALMKQDKVSILTTYTLYRNNENVPFMNKSEGPHQIMFSVLMIEFPVSKSVRNTWLFFISHPAQIILL
jgi:hypothetical protein